MKSEKWIKESSEAYQRLANEFKEDWNKEKVYSKRGEAIYSLWKEFEAKAEILKDVLE